MVRKRFLMNVFYVFLVCIFLFIAYQIVFVKYFKIQYKPATQTLYNPMMGLAPSADYADIVGENTLVYVGITFRELEPQEGIFDFDAIREKYHLDQWKSEGKQVVFRLICDNPEAAEHMDIPDWLYEKTMDGDFYINDYGKGYAPDYGNETFIKYHAEAVKALGEEFGGDTFFCYVELGSIGHWGEWHVNYESGIKRLPDEQTCEAYITPYIDAFPNAIFLMRRPFGAVTKYNMGVYNDMAGLTDDTLEWLDWIENGGIYDGPSTPFKYVATPGIWNTRPIGGEFTSAISMRELLEEKSERTIQLIEQTHMTFIGPKIPTKEDDLTSYEDDIHTILQHVGYRYGVEKCNIRLDKLFKRAEIKLTIANRGIAPLYVNWPMYLYILDENDKVIEKHKIDIELTKLTGNTNKTVKLVLQRESLKNEMCTIAIGIENPEKKEAAIFLNMNSESTDKRYILWK